MWGEDDGNQEFSKVDEGKYVVELTNSTLDSTTEGSNEDPYKLKLEYTIRSPKFERRKLWQNFRFNERSVKFLRWQLSKLGVWESLKGSKDQKEAAFKAAESIFKLVEMKDLFFRVKVEHNEYNGNVYENMIIEDMISGPLPQVTESKKEGQNAPEFDSSEEIPF